EERLDESWVQGVPACEFVRGFEPVDAPVPSSDEAVEAPRHVNRYARILFCHHVALSSNTIARSTARRHRTLSALNEKELSHRWRRRALLYSTIISQP